MFPSLSKALLTALIHSWVQTDMGQRLADAVGFPEPPTSVEDSTRKLLEQVDTLSEETSGKFLYGEKELPW
jgi:norsolorinic acid ketoreductase